MEQNGKRNTDEYRAMQAELGRLADAMADANTQAKIMSDDYQNMNTVLEVMGGISGAFSAAQGAVGLFAGENENLQKIMVKVQSLMAITIGLQQVAKTIKQGFIYPACISSQGERITYRSGNEVCYGFGYFQRSGKGVNGDLNPWPFSSDYRCDSLNFQIHIQESGSKEGARRI